MEAKDLRIGNYVEILGNIDEIKGIGSNENGEYAEFKNTYNRYYLIHDNEELVKPIPLTEEWLLKFGFEKKSWFSEGIVIECVYYEKNGIVVYLIGKGFEIEIKHKERQFNLFKVWQYIHQLQNLFFCLCAEELHINN